MAALAAACSTTGIRHAPPATGNLQQQGPVGECARLYREVDAAVASTGVGDAQSARIPGFPYLRINRHLAAVAPEAGASEFPVWVDRLRALDRRARRAELANMPASATSQSWPERLERCAATLRRHDLSPGDARNDLAAATVPDDYQPALRVLGLYPLAAIPFLQGVRNLHRETRETFATALEELPVEGELRRIVPDDPAAPLSAEATARILERAGDNPLRVPEPDAADRQRLLRGFAPIWEIDTATPADRPGHPVVSRDGPPDVRGEPVVFTHVSHTRWQGQSLLQLNYVIWFPARPRQGPFDLVGGHLDGITWRVTLGPDGRPLLYDVVHNCGCYHKVFPTPRVELVARHRGWEEPISVPQTVDDGAGRLVLRVAATTHYVQRVHRHAGTSARQGYRLADYDRLRSLPLQGGGSRSLFRPDGIVPGTERRERWLFWPMGVPEPGAMRQWGNHAVAFVGRRHFDDPGLFERYFAPAQ